MWFLGTQITYSEFEELVDKAAAALKENGVKRGDRVAIVLPNCPANLVAFYAIVSLGATAVYHNPLVHGARAGGAVRGSRGEGYGVLG